MNLVDKFFAGFVVLAMSAALLLLIYTVFSLIYVFIGITGVVASVVFFVFCPLVGHFAVKYGV